MKPPEKIYIQEWVDGTLRVSMGRFTDAQWEYHLAPVWHDAKEPPEEEKILVSIFGDTYIGFVEGEDWHYLADNGWNVIRSKYVTGWMPLPRTPEEK
jgi:hypothetical protein